MSPAIKAAQVNLRLDPALKSAAERAALREHRSLTALIEKLLSDHLRTQPTLENWHDRACGRFAQLLAASKVEPKALRSRVVKSYRLKTTNGEQVAAHQLQSKLRMISGELDNPTTFFRPSISAHRSPYFTSDSDLRRGELDEVLEFFGEPSEGLVEFWRVSAAGLAVDIRALREDTFKPARRRGPEAGKWVSPFFMVRDLAAFLYHIERFAKEFPSADRVEVRCEWSGLIDRIADDPDFEFHLLWKDGSISRDDNRRTEGEWPISDIRSNLPGIVSTLAGPVIRLFDPTFQCSSDWIRQQGFRS